MKDYLRCIASVDDGIGRMLGYLKEAGLEKDTIVIYCSDQGFYLGEHGWFDKRWMYEESLRTPMLVRWPGVVKPGSRNGDIVSPIDFAGTFCEVAGIETPNDLHGRSLVPVLKGKTPKDWRKSFYYHYYEYPGWHYVRRHYGVADGRYKLIHFYEKDVDQWELFDLKADPSEMKSVYGQPELAKVQKRLVRQLAFHRKELGVPAEDPPHSVDQAPAARSANPPPQSKFEVAEVRRFQNMMRGWIVLPVLCLAGFCLLQPSALGGKIYKSRINPNWAPDDSHMWYRNDLAQGAREYVLVDLKKGTREPAFDQEKLAKALVEKASRACRRTVSPSTACSSAHRQGKPTSEPRASLSSGTGKPINLGRPSLPYSMTSPQRKRKPKKNPGITDRAANFHRMENGRSSPATITCS